MRSHRNGGSKLQGPGETLSRVLFQMKSVILLPSSYSRTISCFPFPKGGPAVSFESLDGVSVRRKKERRRL
jgi:hypothetical protein